MKTLAINLRTFDVTEYDGVQFNSSCSWNGKNVYANQDGIFSLVPEDEADKTPITISTGDMDFGTPYRKSLTEVHVLAEANAPMTLSITVDRGAVFPTVIVDAIDSPMGFDLFTYPIPRGLLGKVWQFELSTASTKFFVSKIDFIVVDTTRT